jgi:hypothetical protein
MDRIDRIDRIKTKKREKGTRKHEKTCNCSESIHHGPHDITPTTAIREP